MQNHIRFTSEVRAPGNEVPKSPELTGQGTKKETQCQVGETKDANGNCLSSATDLCASSVNKLSYRKTIKFPKPNQACAWGLNGNLTEAQADLRARFEQTVDAGLPKGAVVCSIDAKFPTQTMKYDDHLLLTFNNIVITTTQVRLLDYLNNRGTPLNPMYEYDWNTLLGNGSRNAYVGSSESMCLDSRPEAKCFWPASEVTGTVNITIDPSAIQKISDLTRSRELSEFRLVTFGDDNTTDCIHDEISFDVVISYLLTNK